MPNITENYMDKKFDQLDKKLAKFATKDDLKQFEIHITDQVDNLAGMVKRGFDEIYKKLDVRETVERHDRDIRMIKEALHIATR